MLAIQHIYDHGPGRKEAHTLRGLASQGFRYADVDYEAHLAAWRHARDSGTAVGIGYAHVIRARPKVPGRGL